MTKRHVGSIERLAYRWYGLPVPGEVAVAPAPQPVRREAVSPPLPRAAPRAAPQPASGIELRKLPGGGFGATCAVAPGKTFHGHWDTGADKCSINHDIARNHLGLNLSRLRHDVDLITADGRSGPAAVVTVDWRIEGVLIRNVPTVIRHQQAKGGGLNLIGMSLISKLRGTKTVGDRLFIYPHRDGG